MAAIIIDLDGTLLDSMEIWEKFAIHYLTRIGKQPKQNLPDQLREMTLDEAAAYLKWQYALDMTCAEIEQGFYEQLLMEYKSVLYKDGARSFLSICREKQLPVCVFTANQYDLSVQTLQRLGLLSYCRKVITCETCGFSKRNIESYAYVAQRLQCPLSECIVIEDALHAVQSAKRAGCMVWAMYDASNESDWKQICAWADDSFREYQKMEEELCRRY